MPKPKLKRKPKAHRIHDSTYLMSHPPDGEIILKLGYFIEGTKKEDYPVFELWLLADEPGYRFLARHFAQRAKDARRWAAKAIDDDCHRHLGRREMPLNVRLSDEMEIRTDLLTPTNRKLLSILYGLAPSSSRTGSMAPHLRKLAKEAEVQVRKEARHLKRYLARQRKKSR